MNNISMSHNATLWVDGAKYALNAGRWVSNEFGVQFENELGMMHVIPVHRIKAITQTREDRGESND